MNRIDQTLNALQKQKKQALSIFLTAGMPSLKATEDLVVGLAQSGVNLFEIGFPFSDPIADGPVIQKSSQQSLDQGTTWQNVLDLARSIRARCDAALVMMTYSNALYCRGWKKSVQQLAKAGYDGLIIPDLIPEESSELLALCKQYNLRNIYLAAPTSPEKRLQAIGRDAGGFIYCVSVAGVTGGRAKLPVKNIQEFLRRVKKYASVPVLLGFGISSPEQCQEFAKDVDGFIIGSKMIEVISQDLPNAKLVEKAQNFVKPFLKVL